MAATLISTNAHARGYNYHKEHHLGPTGLFGVTSPTNIKITKVEEGSPADGKIKPDDVILGVGETKFKADARRELSDAIDQAETVQSKGVLTLKLEGGKTVDLKLKVLGAYSETAPYDCPKTNAIITQTADYLVRTKKFGDARLNIGLLGLLATGEKKYVDFVGKTIRENAKLLNPEIEDPLTTGGGGFVGWYWGYTNLLLCEYFLITGDEAVLPAIRKYSEGIARGQDAAGLWNHRLATLDANEGVPHARLFGYATVNQTCLPLLISMILSEKCGVTHPEVARAILKTHTFYSNYIRKGALPYGVHGPADRIYNNNGTSASAAVAFAVKGSWNGASFFSRLSAASHGEVEKGHTGHFFAQLWSPLGANVAGPEVTKEFFKKTGWLHTINRKWDGNFTFDGCGYANGIFTYRGLSDAGSHLLGLCVARRKLFITGKNADESLWLRGEDARDAIKVSTMDMANMSAKELIDLTGHDLPQIRRAAAWNLRDKDGDHTEALRALLKDGTWAQREGACRAVGSLGEKSLLLLEDLAVIIRDPWEDSWIRERAVSTLCQLGRIRAGDKEANTAAKTAEELGKPARKYFADLLEVILSDEPDDPFDDLDRTIAMSMSKYLCPDPYKLGLVQANERLFYEAINKLLDHKHHWGRTFGMSLIRNIPLEDLHHVANKMVYVILDKDRTYTAYHGDGQRSQGLKILDRLNIKDAIDLTVDTIEQKTGRIGARVYKKNGRLAQLEKFGANAKPYLDRLKKMKLSKTNVDPVVKAIEESTVTREMISLEEAVRIGRERGR
jgi:hypothetical protein